MSFGHLLCLGSCGLAAFAAAVSAQAPGASMPRARLVAQVGRVAQGQAPTIDGKLDDECWRTAPAIGELTMVEPWEGRAPSRSTVTKLLHDRDNFYIALWCEEDPAAVIATMRARDARLDPDDRVEIVLDPLESRQIAYFFQIGAGGSIGDGLISANGNKFDKPWDTIWSGAVTRGDAGWFAEIAIPFASLPRREAGGSWGFNLRRHARARSEEYQWNNPRQQVSFFRPSEFGTIEGFGEIDSGLGLEVVPYVSLNVGRDRRAADDSWDVDPDAGGEIYWRLSPSMKLATTVFTDFAQTEVDGRQINLNRFPLFFPEKRDFFLDGAGYFQFGASNAGNTTFLPYFSRRIGLSPDGTPIPLLGGVKLAGRSGPFEVGLLDVQADSSATTDEENLAVARVRYSLAEETAIGLIATHGDPSSAGDNSVFGVDFYHRWPAFIGDLDLQLQIDAAGSTGSQAGDEGESLGVDLRSRGREWELQLGTRWISEDFAPELGFVSRTGTRASVFEVGYRPRVDEGGTVRNWIFVGSAQRAASETGELQDASLRLDQLGLRLQTDDSVYVFVYDQFERVEDDFTLFGGSTTVFAGDYDTVRGGARITSSEARPWNVDVRYETGEFFDGHSDDFVTQGQWRTSALLHLGADYRTTKVDLGPGRGFTTQIGAARVDLHFSPVLSVYNLVQYDNESNEIGWQSRLRWSYAPGSDFFAVLGTTWLREDGAVTPTEQTMAFKVQHTLRF